ncbi:MAG TPA: nuclear transport factor 2 family protein [Stellaceae bacterium]|jgi:limonene-1,2-epoxide hydrolase|nr:nuclear transport factor 2 family protein [Stellaceae bacterium]
MAGSAEIVAAFQQAMSQGDFAVARKLLRDDVSFVGPIGSFGDADSLLAALRALQANVESADIRKVFADGQDVCVVFDLAFKQPRHTALIAEWHKVEDGRIAMMRAMFDARPFDAMLKRLFDRHGSG